MSNYSSLTVSAASPSSGNTTISGLSHYIPNGGGVAELSIIGNVNGTRGAHMFAVQWNASTLALIRVAYGWMVNGVVVGRTIANAGDLADPDEIELSEGVVTLNGLVIPGAPNGSHTATITGTILPRS